MADEQDKTGSDESENVRAADIGLNVIARVAITRRVGDNFQHIAPNTPFVCQDRDELGDLRLKKAIYDSPQEKADFERAIEGTSVPRSRPGITLTPVSEEALHREAAYAANRLTGPGAAPAHNPAQVAAVRKRMDEAAAERARILAA